MPADVLASIMEWGLDRPQHRALVDDRAILTYGELREAVVTAARGLQQRGVQPGQRVALLVPNSVDFVVTALATMWAGACIVPLSGDDPAAHLAHIIRDCRPSMAVTSTGELSPQLAGLLAETTDLPPSARPSDLLRGTGPVPPGVDDPARDVYMIYTSGTTGAPKGVRISAAALAWSVAGVLEATEMDGETRSMAVSSFHWDGSYATLFPTLAAGGTLVIPDRQQLMFLRRFFQTVTDFGITHTSTGPAYLRLLLASKMAVRLRATQLRCCALGGEQLLASDVSGLWDLLPSCRVINRYGPTEATIAVTNYVVTADDVEQGRVPIGAPQRGSSFHVLGPGGQEVSQPDIVGELYIGGVQLMNGYWGDEERTSQVMRADLVPGSLAYRTGDLVYMGEHGLYYYVGRNDQVVKRYGYRISLVELAGLMQATLGAMGAICAAIDGGTGLAIAAFVETGDVMAPQDLLSQARECLPVWMVPDRVYAVEHFPINSVGKVDRTALLEAHGLTAWKEP